MSYKSAIFLYIKLKFSVLVYSVGFYNMYSVFFETESRSPIFLQIGCTINGPKVLQVSR